MREWRVGGQVLLEIAQVRLAVMAGLCCRWRPLAFLIPVLGACGEVGEFA